MKPCVKNTLVLLLGVKQHSKGGGMSESCLAMYYIRPMKMAVLTMEQWKRREGPRPAGPVRRIPDTMAAHGLINACMRERGAASVLL